MKKLISVLLAVLMLFSLTSVAFAADDKAPVIIVSGMGTDQYEVNEDGSKTKVWPPEIGGVVNAAIPVLGSVVVSAAIDDYSGVTAAELKGIKDIFVPLSCDENGHLLSNLTPDLYPLAIGNYPEDFNEENDKSEKAICRSIGDAIGYENSYFFNYTWSRNPMEIADDLSAYIKDVMSQTGAKKVSLVACSMGGTITMSYIYKYGTSKLKNVTFASTAFLGTEIVGQLFNKDVNIDIYDALRYFSEFTGYDFVRAIVRLVEGILVNDRDNILDGANEFIHNLVDNLKEVAFSDIFLDTFVTMPGIWALIPNSYYEGAKATLVTDKAKYAFLENGENSIDNYMNNVQSKVPELLAKAKKNGVNVYVTATYMCPGIPVQMDSTNYTDNLIDVKYQGGYATVAKYGEKLDTTLNTVCKDSSHNHLSPDSIIDASTCISPEQTWFIKGVGHMNYTYGTGLCGLLTLLSTSTKEVSITTDAAYPQFTEYNQTTKELSTEFKPEKENNFVGPFGHISDIVDGASDFIKDNVAGIPLLSKLMNTAAVIVRKVADIVLGLFSTVSSALPTIPKF